MKRLRIVGLALLAIFALGAIASSSAMANPELLPLPTEKEPLTFSAESKELSELQANKGLNNIDCKTLKATGSFTSVDLGKGTLDFGECTANAKAVKCWSLGDEKSKSPDGTEKSVILVDNADLHLVDILPAGKLELGLAVILLSELHIECQGGLLILVSGTVIGVVEGVTTLVKTKTMKLNFAAKEGVQNVRECMTLETFCKGKKFELLANFGGGPLPAAEIAKATVTLGKETEVHF
jgi:hypothetical protein